MTTHHTDAVTGGSEPEGIDWERLGQEVRDQAGWPTPGEVAPGADALACDCGSDVCLSCTLSPAGRIDIDPEADASLWPQVLDAKGRATGELARPNPVAMRAALYRASSTDPAEVDYLAESVSEAEARAIIAQAARQREIERALEGDLAERRAHLAAEGARRQARHEARLAEARRRRERRAEGALERRFRALDPTGRVVRLAAAERVVPWMAVAPAVLAAVLGAINVGSMLNVISPSTQAINVLVEPLLTLPLLAILAAQILGAIPTGGASPYRRLEVALIAVAVGLNIGLHVSVDGWTPTAAVWAIVPAGLAVSAHLVPRLMRQVREALAEAGDGAQGGAASTSAAYAPASGPAGPTPAAGSARGSAQGPPPQVRAGVESSPIERLVEAVQARQIDPRRGAPVDPTSAASIARTLRIREARAAELRDQYRALIGGDQH